MIVKAEHHEINIRANEPQQIFISQNLDHVEEFPGDPLRVRLVLITGQAGKWFSRLWNPVDFHDVF